MAQITGQAGGEKEKIQAKTRKNKKFLVHKKNYGAKTKRVILELIKDTKNIGKIKKKHNIWLRKKMQVA